MSEEEFSNGLDEGEKDGEEWVGGFEAEMLASHATNN